MFKASQHVLCLLGPALLALSAAVSACPICLGIVPQTPTLAEEVTAARDVVLAGADGAEGKLRVTSVIKGDPDLIGQSATAVGETKGDGLFILARRNQVEGWKLQGPSGLSFANFLPTVAALPDAAPATDAEWTARLERMRPFLGHAEARIARSAWAMWAGAPYRIVTSQAPQFSRAQLHEWLAAPALAGQRSLWLVLLGLQGGEEDAAWLTTQAEAAWKSGDDTHLPALLTALVARRGAAGVDFIEQRYIRDRGRTLEEIQAALAALGLHGREGDLELKQRIIAAYRVFITERKPLAGFVARDLAEWQEWEFAPAFQAIVASSEPVHPTARQRITAYLGALPAK